MKRVITCLFLLTTFAVANGQHNYVQAMRQGDSAFIEKNYKTAINKYFAAEAFDPTKKDLVKAKVDNAFDSIEALRAVAEKAKDEAVTAKNEAVKAKLETEKVNKLITEQRKTALVHQLTAQSELTLNKDLDESILLALKSIQINYTPEAEAALRKSLALFPRRVFKFSHDQSITNMTVSRDNKWLATASSDHTATVWDIQTGQKIFTARHDTTVKFIAIDSQSKYLAASSADGSAVLWEISTAKEIYRFQKQIKSQRFIGDALQPITKLLSGIKGIAFTSNGQYFIIACADSTIQVIDIQTLKQRTLKTDLSLLDNITFSPNGEFIANITQTSLWSSVIVWEVMTGNKKSK